MKRRRIIILTSIIIIATFLFGVFSKTNENPISNVEKVAPTISATIIPTEEGIRELHFTEEQLKEYYSAYKNLFVLHIRKSLDNYLAGASEGINQVAIRVDKSENGTIGGLDFFSKDYYKSKFIVFAINDGVMEGKVISIVFQDKPDKLFNAWVYKLAGGNYELRGFWQNDNLTEKEMKKIQTEYRIYLEDKQHAL